MDASLDPTSLDVLLTAALEEDLGDGDRTTMAVGVSGLAGHGLIEAQASMVVAGLPIVERIFGLVDPDAEVELRCQEGSRVESGARLVEVHACFGTLLAGERLALNLLGHLSGIATMTRTFVDAAAGSSARIADTRKTLPGLRALEKYAVSVGGGENHRMGLYDAILIKNNHIDAVGGIDEALARVVASGDPGPIEVEVRDLDELDRALAHDPEWILLDNFSLEQLAEGVRRARARSGVRLEASGGMTLERVAAVASTGVDRISVGALTHSAAWADVHLVLRPSER